MLKLKVRGHVMSDVLTFIYSVALGLGLIFSILQIVAQGLEGAFDALHIDFHHGDSDLGVSMLALSWFITSFGGFGLIAQQAGIEGSASLGIALIGGLAFGGVAQLIFVLVLARAGGSTFSQESLIGRTAEVTTPIPVNRVGQISLIASGSRVSYNARAIKRDIELLRGQRVRIVDFIGSVAHVEPALGADEIQIIDEVN
jgi:membrane protein implicated in regulation of membrane protease activity